MKWYADNQNPENGTWQSTLTYGAANGLMKVALVYSAYEKEFPNAETAANSAIDIILLEHLNEAITSFYNPWITISMLIKNLERFGHTDAAERVKARLHDNLPAMLRMTRRKVIQFAKADGGFSYNITRSCPTSQGAPVAVVDTPEGDVNGNYLSTVGVVRNVCSSLGLNTLPFYVKEDGELFFELIASSYQAKKITPNEYKSKK